MLLEMNKMCKTRWKLVKRRKTSWGCEMFFMSEFHLLPTATKHQRMRARRTWMIMNEEVKGRTTFHLSFSRRSFLFCPSSRRLRAGIIRRSWGNALHGPKHRKEITCSTWSGAESCSKPPDDSPSHAKSLTALPPRSREDGGMGGQRERWKRGEDEWRKRSVTELSEGEVGRTSFWFCGLKAVVMFL